MKLTAIVLLSALAAPVFAEAMKIDAATVTCAEMMKMDAAGMTDAGKAIKEAKKADAKTAAMTAEDVTKAAEAACKAHPDGTVLEALKM